MNDNSTSSSGGYHSASGLPKPDPLLLCQLAPNRSTLLIGPSGTGKTVFALQSMVTLAQRGEPGIFASFEASPDQLAAQAAAFGWDLRELERRGLLALHGRVQPRIDEGGWFDARELLESLLPKARKLGARRLVLDGAHVMLALMDHSRGIQQVLRVRDWLNEHEFTAILTACVQSDDAQLNQRYSFLDLAAECVVCFCSSNGSRKLQVVKYRGASAPSQVFQFELGTGGIRICPPGPTGGVQALSPPFADLQQARVKLSASIQALDNFLEIKQAEFDFLLNRSEEEQPHISDTESVATETSRNQSSGGPPISKRSSQEGL